MNKDELFVKKWLEAIRNNKNQSWIAEELSTSRQYVSAHAAYLRKKGVKLPKMEAGWPSRNMSNVKSLNDLIENEDM